MTVNRDEDGLFWLVGENGDDLAGPFRTEDEAYEAMDEAEE